MTKRFLVRVGFPIETEFSHDGVMKYEYEDILVRAWDEEHATKRLLDGYGDTIKIERIKRVLL